MASNRCSICGTNWPRNDDFKECPKCELPTSPLSNVKAMNKAEAYSEKRHLEFESFYEEWDASHPASRLSTDGLPEYAAASDPVAS